MADCIKIAIDFVSPENIDRCEKLTKEFREQNQSKVWKEDVLQLRTMMWFAWQSCSILEAGLDKEEASAPPAATGTYRNLTADRNDEGSGFLIEGGRSA
jgi:lysine-specific demethylase 3